MLPLLLLLQSGEIAMIRIHLKVGKVLALPLPVQKKE
jgi:hypothetical protein